jgi:hypothetical protein
VLVGDHDVLHRDERSDDDALDGEEELVDGGHAVLRREQQLQGPQVLLAARPRVVVLRRLLDGDVRQVHEVVRDVRGVGPKEFSDVNGQRPSCREPRRRREARFAKSDTTRLQRMLPRAAARRRRETSVRSPSREKNSSPSTKNTAFGRGAADE